MLVGQFLPAQLLGGSRGPRRIVPAACRRYLRLLLCAGQWPHALRAKNSSCPVTQAAGHVKAIHMIWSKDGESGGRGYHHGNLKDALVAAALDLSAKKGPFGFTFAEAARWAGVSPAAPYRHFRDRDELVANVALRGFELFE